MGEPKPKRRPLTLCARCGLCKEHGDHDASAQHIGTHRWDPVTSREWSPCPSCKTRHQGDRHG
jgi:hypothetical protein